jgi:hypothetical protein
LIDPRHSASPPATGWWGRGQRGANIRLTFVLKYGHQHVTHYASYSIWVLCLLNKSDTKSKMYSLICCWMYFWKFLNYIDLGWESYRLCYTRKFPYFDVTSTCPNFLRSTRYPIKRIKNLSNRVKKGSATFGVHLFSIIYVKPNHKNKNPRHVAENPWN